MVGIYATVAPAKHALYSTCCQKQEIYSDIEIVMWKHDNLIVLSIVQNFDFSFIILFLIYFQFNVWCKIRWYNMIEKEKLKIIIRNKNNVNSICNDEIDLNSRFEIRK